MFKWLKKLVFGEPHPNSTRLTQAEIDERDRLSKARMRVIESWMNHIPIGYWKCKYCTSVNSILVKHCPNCGANNENVFG